MTDFPFTIEPSTDEEWAMLENVLGMIPQQVKDAYPDDVATLQGMLDRHHAAVAMKRAGNV